MDHYQVDHQGTMVETTGSILGTPLSILFNLGATNTFISPSIVSKCKLEVVKQHLGWQVGLASRARISIDSLLQQCALNLGSFFYVSRPLAHPSWLL